MQRIKVSPSQARAKAASEEQRQAARADKLVRDAAPAMLAALKLVVQRGSSHGLGFIIADVNAAIDKAEGR